MPFYVRLVYFLIFYIITYTYDIKVVYNVLEIILLEPAFPIYAKYTLVRAGGEWRCRDSLGGTRPIVFQTKIAVYFKLQ